MANVYATRPDAKQKIADAGLTQVELAERTGISRVMINKALHGHYRLRGAYAWRIAQAVADHTGVPIHPGHATMWGGEDSQLSSRLREQSGALGKHALACRLIDELS